MASWLRGFFEVTFLAIFRKAHARERRCAAGFLAVEVADLISVTDPGLTRAFVAAVDALLFLVSMLRLSSAIKSITFAVGWRVPSSSGRGDGLRLVRLYFLLNQGHYIVPVGIAIMTRVPFFGHAFDQGQCHL